jgi:prepilin-type N-terminal cleavage/methylation domain-containing protein
VKVLSTIGRKQRAFTLIEIMVVVALIGLIMTIAIPSFVNTKPAHGMPRALGDLLEAFRLVRANAIISGKAEELVIHPKTKQFEITGPTPFSATLPSDVWIEIVGVNFVELTGADEARVKFQPNATCDEFDMIMLSSGNDKVELKLEVVTGLVEVKNIP